MSQLDFFPENQRSPATIMREALSHDPIAIYALFSGGDDSLAATAWMMENVDGCRVAHIATGIGTIRGREYVHDLCRDRGWDLTEIRAKEDCGSDYEEIIRKYGFPGPSQHMKMYVQLKERCIELLVRREKAKINDPKRKRTARVLLATGIRHDESANRMRYSGKEISFKGAQMWVNHIYWRDQAWCWDYARARNLPRNPVREILGISGECLCGAHGSAEEKALIRLVCPRTADRIAYLEGVARECGHDWGWGEGGPPSVPFVDPDQQDMWRPMCAGCGKSGQ
jgi:3'-phosphoadenosine 5'-phosphosulfate sulfotransferase (PAPS reductase)/FAD synthetase